MSDGKRWLGVSGQYDPIVRSRDCVLSVAFSVALGAVVAAVSTWVSLVVAAVLCLLLVVLHLPKSATIGILGVLVAAIPKSGVRLEQLPLPIMLLALGVALLVLNDRRATRLRPQVISVLILLVLWMSARLFLIVWAGGSLAQIVALVAWSVLPAAVLAFASRRPVTATGHQLRRRWGFALEVGVMIACIFGLVQALGGIEATKISGITIAAGDSYASKYVDILAGDSDPFSKIPSTYHNGNIFGVVTGFFFVTAASRAAANGASRWDIVLLGLTGTATLLAASRSVLLAVGLAVLVGGLGRASLRRKIGIGAGAGLIAAVGLLMQPGLAERFSLSSLMDSTGAGRTERWADVVEVNGFHLVLGTTDWVTGTVSEGAVGAAQQIGVIGIGLTVLLAARVTCPANMREWRLPLVVVAGCFVLDSSYLVFPTLFIPFARMWSPFETRGQSSTRQRTNQITSGRRDSSGGVAAATHSLVID